MTKITTYTTTGTKDGEVELPLIFSTPFRRELIHKAVTNLTSHKFQPQGRHPSAGQDVVADSNDEQIKINPDGGYKHFGLVKGDFIILKGSVPGTYRRLIKLRSQIRNAPAKVNKPNILEVVI